VGEIKTLIDGNFITNSVCLILVLLTLVN